ncbi:DUF3267 domain protein [Natrialba magadii ATCC 43099]|uniref:DUF3267 domain protein n=1 Tax=Natrialba magadii (strain ATCC 43099 / DSM 3394 / CCM 3739 / CIP 104546 / IAM 13178 / JCM 8861 / NBRC 102185 / NCIMB 2190 / MS3) TaxID=547559 RepID=D3SWY5_NATMM|nr:DUF3267 domain-containing protein [Natrialba magadii]ADD05867.1 DUF3267 domain protein [Natrialba magadii ATCC 43099]ELY30625.1 hypothetical protein C500_08897 [Natrialba magadii ATCC 43099]
MALQWLVVSVVGFFALGYCLAHLHALFRGERLEQVIVPALPPGTFLFWLGLAALVLGFVVVLHEGCHGLFMARYGSDPSYGIGFSYALFPYAYAAVGDECFTRNQLFAILVAPFVVITVGGLAIMAAAPEHVLSLLLILALAANGAGSVGDLWMAAVLLQYPSRVRVDALPDNDVQGFAIYDPESGPTQGSETRHLPGMTHLSRIATGAVATLALLGTTAIALVLVSLAAGSGTVEIVTDRLLLFRHEVDSSGVARFELGEALFAGVSLAGGLCWAGLGAVRDHVVR